MGTSANPEQADALTEDSHVDFGICIMAKPDSCARQAQAAEEFGFSHIWVADTQMMAGDVFVCLALIAAATRRVKLGTALQSPAPELRPSRFVLLAP